MIEVILARTQVRVMSDKMMITKKKKPLKELAKLIAPLFPILGIYAGTVYLCITYPPSSNNVFMLSLNLWLIALDINLAAIIATYITKDLLQSSITGLRPRVIRNMKLITITVRIFTVIAIVLIGLVLVTYPIYLRATASGLIKISAPLTSQQVIILLLLLVMLLPLAYIVRRETEKVIRLGMENAMNT